MIQSVDRAIRILKALAAGPGRLGVSELSERLGLAKGTVHGLLRTLQDHGLVEQHRDSDKYQLGPQLLQLSNRYLDLSELRSRSLAWSELLASRTEEAVLGEVGLAAPIFDRRGEPVGAVGVAGPRERVLRRGREGPVAAAVIEAARGISRDLGAPRWPV